MSKSLVKQSSLDVTLKNIEGAHVHIHFTPQPAQNKNKKKNVFFSARKIILCYICSYISFFLLIKKKKKKVHFLITNLLNSGSCLSAYHLRLFFVYQKNNVSYSSMKVILVSSQAKIMEYKQHI